VGELFALRFLSCYLAIPAQNISAGNGRAISSENALKMYEVLNMAKREGFVGLITLLVLPEVKLK